MMNMKVKGKPIINKIKVKEVSAKEAMDYSKICEHLGYIFPKSNQIIAMLDKDRYQSKCKKIDDVYIADYLPFFLNDQTWLTNYVVQLIEKAEPDYKIKAKHVENFISKSSAFASVRSYYEVDLIEANIRYLYDSFKNIKDLRNIDELFRDEVLRFMNHVDIDPHTIEANLEKKADLWREQMMLKAFENKYAMHDVAISKHSDLWKKYFENFKQAHKKVWMKQREYAYYQNHKDIIDELGLATKNMKINQSHAKILNYKLDKFEKKFEQLVSKQVKKSIFNINILKPKQKNVQKETFNPNGVILKIKDGIEK